MRRLPLFAALPLLALSLLGPALAPARTPAPVAARPALWKLADADTTIWLFGTIHVLPAGYKWRGPVLDRAIAGSASLTLETVLDTDPARVGRLLVETGRESGLPPIAERVPADKRAVLATLIAKSGFTAEQLSGFKTWAAAVLLTGAALHEIGVGTTPDSGVEPQLTATFRAAGKPVEGLETPEQQLGFFARVPEASQRAFLVATLDRPEEARADFDRMLRGWSRGDVAAIERAFAEEPDFTPALRDVLIRQRDAAWAAALADRLKRPGTLFVAVGAGHLAGPDSVQQMLAARGLAVRRIQ